MTTLRPARLRPQTGGSRRVAGLLAAAVAVMAFGVLALRPLIDPPRGEVASASATGRTISPTVAPSARESTSITASDVPVARSGALAKLAVVHGRDSMERWEWPTSAWLGYHVEFCADGTAGPLGYAGTDARLRLTDGTIIAPEDPEAEISPFLTDEGTPSWLASPAGWVGTGEVAPGSCSAGWLVFRAYIGDTAEAISWYGLTMEAAPPLQTALPDARTVVCGRLPQDTCERAIDLARADLLEGVARNRGWIELVDAAVVDYECPLRGPCRTSDRFSAIVILAVAGPRNYAFRVTGHGGPEKAERYEDETRAPSHIEALRPVPPQKRSGPGWRLLTRPADSGPGAFGGQGAIALSQERFARLWAPAGASTSVPDVDFEREVVLFLERHDTCGSRLDDIVVDRSRHLVHGLYLPDGYWLGCDLEGHSTSFVVALAREKLPETFRVPRVDNDHCIERCQENRIEVDLRKGDAVAPQVPRLVGLTYDQAERALDASGHGPGVHVLGWPGAASGVIVGQSPPEGWPSAEMFEVGVSVVMAPRETDEDPYRVTPESAQLLTARAEQRLLEQGATGATLNRLERCTPSPCLDAYFVTRDETWRFRLVGEAVEGPFRTPGRDPVPVLEERADQFTETIVRNESVRERVDRDGATGPHRVELLDRTDDSDRCMSPHGDNVCVVVRIKRGNGAWVTVAVDHVTRRVYLFDA